MNSSQKINYAQALHIELVCVRGCESDCTKRWVKQNRTPK